MPSRNPLDLYRKHFGFVGALHPESYAEQARVQILSSTIGRVDKLALEAQRRAQEAGLNLANKLTHGKKQGGLAKPTVVIPNSGKGQVPSQRPAPAAYLGVPIFMPCTIDGYLLPFEPLVEIGGGKSIVRTALAGYDGTVKEDMGMDDYAITIRGIVLNEDSDDYPEAEVLRLRALFEKAGALDIICPLLNLFGVSRIALENLRLPGEEGVLHYQPYEFTGYSDFDVEILLKENLDLVPLKPRVIGLQ